jgi:hypothetical protein
VVAPDPKDIADSAHGVLGLSVKGTVVAEPTPVWYSPHPYTELQVPESVYPAPAVNASAGGGVSVLPITIELALGVKEATEEVVDPAAELPVDVWRPVRVAPDTS